MGDTVKTNWPAIFVAYTNGAAPIDICREFLISLPDLEKRARDQSWERLREKLPAIPMELSVTDFGQAQLQSLERIQDNRERNIRVIQKLQTDLEKVVEDLVADKLMVVEFKTTKDGVHELERALGVHDRVALASYAQKIFEMSYKALGDSVALSGEAGGAAGSGDKVAGSKNVVFQINMPGVMANPRPTRDNGPVVEVTSPVES